MDILVWLVSDIRVQLSSAWHIGKHNKKSVLTLNLTADVQPMHMNKNAPTSQNGLKCHKPWQTINGRCQILQRQKLIDLCQ